MTQLAVRTPDGAPSERDTLRLTVYLTTLSVATAVPTAWLLAVAWALGMTGWKLACLGICSSIAMSESAQRLVHFAVGLLFGNRRVATLNFDGGIPDDCRTAVVVPALLSDHQTTRQLLASLERHHLSNMDANLRFVLLTDFMDAQAAVMAADAELLEHVERGIAHLNRVHGGGDGDNFFLMHRPRLWAPVQGLWMGRERKRGKLMDFNALMRHRDLGAFSRAVGDIRRLEGIRFVITLDADTGLPQGAARTMVAAMAHPSNLPVLHPLTGVVVAGHGVMQPRMMNWLDAGSASWRQRLACDVPPPTPRREPPVNIDQCLFGTGAFFGKGIYDVAAFEQALAQRMPDDWILSHDLLEGCHARCAALPAVELTESVPSSLLAELRRRHRWIRGDWQSAPWALPRVPLGDGHWGRNPLSALSRWRILDNLRRTVWPGATFVMLLLCVAGLDVWWPAAVLTGTAFFLSMLVEGVFGLLGKDRVTPVAVHLTYWLRCFGRDLYRATSALMLLPVDAAVAASAIVTALWRMLWSRHRMLEWVASDRSQRDTPSGLVSHVKVMAAGPLAAFLLVVLAGGTRSIWVAAVLAVLWTASPLVAWVLSWPCETANPADSVGGYGGRTRTPSIDVEASSLH